MNNTTHQGRLLAYIECLSLIDGLESQAPAEALRDFRILAAAWDIPGYWNEFAEWRGADLRAFAEEAAQYAPRPAGALAWPHNYAYTGLRLPAQWDAEG